MWDHAHVTYWPLHSFWHAPLPNCRVRDGRDKNAGRTWPDGTLFFGLLQFTLGNRHYIFYMLSCMVESLITGSKKIAMTLLATNIQGTGRTLGARTDTSVYQQECLILSKRLKFHSNFYAVVGGRCLIFTINMGPHIYAGRCAFFRLQSKECLFKQWVYYMGNINV